MSVIEGNKGHVAIFGRLLAGLLEETRSLGLSQVGGGVKMGSFGFRMAGWACFSKRTT